MQLSSQLIKSLPADELDSLMKCTHNIRHVSVIGGAGYCKSSLVTLLAQQATNLSEDGDGRGASTDATESYPVIPGLVALCATADESIDEEVHPLPCSNKFLINVLDPPDCPNFPGAAAVSLCTTDGALVMIDVNSPISSKRAEIDMLLTTAFKERNRVIVVLNNMESAIVEFLQKPRDGLYTRLRGMIRAINNIMAKSIIKGDQKPLDARKGSIVFASVSHGWAFTIPQFGALLGKKYGADKNRFTRMLWGNNYFDMVERKWRQSPDYEGRTLERSFNQSVLDPIFKTYEAVLRRTWSAGDIIGQIDGRLDAGERKLGDSLVLNDLLKELGVRLSAEEKELEGDDLIRAIMSKFLPASRAILRMTCVHLPSPAAAQPYRLETMFEIQRDEAIERSFGTCDASGPLVIYVTRMIPGVTGVGADYALGRVYSGSVSAGIKIRALPRVQEREVENALVPTGKMAMSVPSVYAGNLLVIELPNGYAPMVLKGSYVGTQRTGLKVNETRPIPIVWVGLDVRNPEDLPKLVERLKFKQKFDPYVEIDTLETGQWVIRGYDDGQLRCHIKTLEGELPDVSIQVSGPFPSYRESIRAESSQVCWAKSPNKHVKFYTKASPMSDELTSEIEQLSYQMKDVGYKYNYFDYLKDHHEWARDKSKRLWAIGHDRSLGNLLVDETKAVQFMNENRDGCTIGFLWAAREGPLCEEPLRSVRVNIVDVTMNIDAIRRGNGQIIPPMRRSTYASVLSASPFLSEPVFYAEVRVPERFVDEIRRIVWQRKGSIVFEGDNGAGYPRSLRVCIRGAQSFGFEDDVQSVSEGSAICRLSFDHWGEMEGDLDAIVGNIRTIKGLDPVIPRWENYYDKA